MASMGQYAKPGGRYGFTLVGGVEVEGTVVGYSSGDSPIKLDVPDRENPVLVNPDLIAFMWIIDESDAETLHRYDGM